MIRAQEKISKRMPRDKKNGIEAPNMDYNRMRTCKKIMAIESN
jgi:hypothetical protein